MQHYGLVLIIVLSQTGNCCCPPSTKGLPTSMMTMTTISPMHTKFVPDIVINFNLTKVADLRLMGGLLLMVPLVLTISTWVVCFSFLLQGSSEILVFF